MKYSKDRPDTSTVMRGSSATCVCPSASTGPRAQTVLLRQGKKVKKGGPIQSSGDVCKLVRGLRNTPQEHLVALHLNNRNEVVSQTLASLGSSNGTMVDPRSIFQAALLANANGIVLVHNHPGGDPTPSPEDLAATRRVANAGEILGIKLLDHVIVGERECVSSA